MAREGMQLLSLVHQGGSVDVRLLCLIAGMARVSCCLCTEVLLGMGIYNPFIPPRSYPPTFFSSDWWSTSNVH